MPFKDNNLAAGLPKNSKITVGRTNVDSDSTVEDGWLLPWPADPAGSYVYYECAIEVMLDDGIAIHNRLPQVDNAPDTLASTFIENLDQDKITNKGVNLISKDRYTDIVQRMAHSRYWFRLWGRALRVGYKIPIPSIKTIGGVAAVQHNRDPQWAYNRISPGGNYGGIPLWMAQWSLWYTTIAPPTSQEIPVVDPGAHITGTTPLPSVAGIQAPFSQADDNAQPTIGKIAKV